LLIRYPDQRQWANDIAKLSRPYPRQVSGRDAYPDSYEMISDPVGWSNESCLTLPKRWHHFLYKTLQCLPV
jgi:hypothetical protein